MKTEEILFQIEHIKNIALSDYDDRYLYERMISEEVEELNELVKESDSLPCFSDQRELFDFKNWWNNLPDESDDKLFITKGTIERFLKSNSR